MDYCLSYNAPFALESLPSEVKVKKTVKASARVPLHRFVSRDRRVDRTISFGGRNSRRALIAVASAGPSNCEFSSLNTPLEPKSSVGKVLSSVLQNDLDCFRLAAGKQLQQLAADRDEAIGRVNLSRDSDDQCLYRRIAELREQECQIAVEDVIYMLILYKFNTVGVHLIPKLSRCVYNGRLEIWPSKDWELESIHGFEVLEMVREHLTAVIGLRADSNVADNWATTQISRLQLCQVYVASIVYGYFLKSASLRHQLELRFLGADKELGITYCNALPLPDPWSCELNNVAFGRMGRTRESCSRAKKHVNTLRRYVRGFDPETLQMCAAPKTKEALNLVWKHSCALFGDEETGSIETSEVVSTSLSSLKRLVLEAIAFGSFLWDTEEYVDTVYRLNEN